MKVPYLSQVPSSAEDVPCLLDQQGLEFTAIAHANWQKEFPYRPEVCVRIAHCGDRILLHYRVKEDRIRAHFGADNGEVWTDSCVEFFCIPAGDGVYYNLECNCIGTILLGVGPEKAGRVRAGQEVLGTISRWSSLGREAFEERPSQEPWEVALIVPVKAFFQHRLTSLRGARVRANFYKCGDALTQAHFLSWTPIQLPKPNFHCPDFFGELEFE